MQPNISPTKISAVANKVIDKIIFASGTVSLLWILAFLMVAMIDK